MRQPSEALWHAGGPLLAAVAVGWLVLGVAAGAGFAAAVAVAVRVLRRRRTSALSAPASARVESPPRSELAQARDATAVADLLLRDAERAAAVGAAALVLVDDDGRRARGLRGLGGGRGVELQDLEFDLEHEPSGIATAVYDGVAFSVFDATASVGPNRAFVDAFGAKSVAYVPLIVDERVIAVLAAMSTAERRAFTGDDLERLQALAAEAAPVLDRMRVVARLGDELERERRRTAQQRALLRAGQELGHERAIDSLDATLAGVARSANEALGGTFAAVLTPCGDAFAAAEGQQFPSALAEVLENGIPDEARSLADSAAHDRVLASADVTQDERFDPSWRELAKRCRYRALLALPVSSARSNETGILLVFYAVARKFTDDDLGIAGHLADAASSAIQRSELFEAERTARALSQQLAQTGRVLATGLEPSAVLEEVVQQAPLLLAADACAIRTVEQEDLVISAASGDGVEDTIGARAPATAWLSGDVFQSRAPLALDDVSADDRLLGADPILARGYAAFVGVPLAGPDGTMHGVLAVYARAPRTWRPEEIEALLTLAATTSAALTNAELYSRVALENERSVAILANIADGIVAVDRDGEVVLWNAAAEQITGVPAAEALRRTPTQVLQRTLESDDDGATGPRLLSITRGAEEVWLSLSEAVMRDPLGAVAGRIFAFRDISADRTVEQVKSDFVAAVSHQLRTPLTSIYGFAETLLREDVLFTEEERRTFLNYIASESERLTGIVDELLNVARLDAGDLQVEPEPIDVASVVSEIVETASEAAAGNGHRFEIDLPQEPLAAEADRDKLRQVFNILVENALKYSPSGGTVTVGVRRGDGTVEVRIVDEGVGIPPGEQERIFRKFYRAETTARDGGGGTGLGLFIAKELVTAMGGRIWVESAEGEGSKFAFELPVAEGP